MSYNEQDGPPPGYRPPQPPGPGDDAHRPLPPESESAAGPGQPREDANAPQVNLKIPGFMTPMTRSHWLRLLASQAMAYVALLSMGVLTLIALIIGVLLSADDQINLQVTQATGGPDLTPSMVIALITLPFQIAAVWLFGAFQFNLGVPESISQLFGGGDGMGLSVWAPNLLFVVLAVALAAWVGRIWFTRAPADAITKVPRVARLVANLVIALVLAGLTLLVTWVFSYRETFDFAEMAVAEGASETEVQQLAQFLGADASELAISMSGNAAGASLFFGAFTVYLITGLLLSVHPRMFSKLRSKAEYFLPSVSAVPRVLATHLLIVVAPALIYVAVAVTIDAGPIGVFSIFFWAWPAAVLSVVLLNFGAITAAGGAAGFGQTEVGADTAYLWTSDFAWWEVSLAILLGVIAIAAASLVWAQRRDARDSTLQNLLSWFTLPLVYALTGVVLVVFGQVRGAVDAFGTVSADFNLGPAWWTFVILLLIGMFIEVLSRFAAPVVVRRLPGPVKRMTGGPPLNT